MITFVHALWGDELISTWPKILRDIQWGWSWRTLPSGYRHLVFAYGEQNFRYLCQFGLEPIQLSRSPVVDFLGTGDREAEGRGSLGTFNFGVSMWEHKRHAIDMAFEHGAEEVLWLDWDTRLQETNEERTISVLHSLQDGPEFAGRLRNYHNERSGGGLTTIYHGGCYYFRSRAIVAEMARIRPLSPYVVDEALITWAINNFYFGGAKASAEQHHREGFDNPKLHGTRVNAVPSVMQPIFFEGKMDRSQPFLVETRRPPDEFRFYQPDRDTAVPNPVV